LIVDRYNGYNKAPCEIQYCYAHLLRLVQDMRENFPKDPEVLQFVADLAEQLDRAMKLRSRRLGRRKFKRQARRIEKAIRRIVDAPAHHTAVQSVQDIFRQHPDRLYHWTEHPRIPAENNLAERELRPLVVARKISFGSQSDAGAKTREILMTVLHTLQKRTPDVGAALAYALDRLAQNPDLDVYALLFNSSHRANLPP
jgi:hypothetical protein